MIVGEKVPDITLVDTERKKVSLSDLKGEKTILLFFPFAFTSVCTTELCSFRDNINVYQKLNADIIGISVDSFYTLAKYKAEEKLNFTLLSDFNKEASKAFDILDESFGPFKMYGVSKRAAFIIDKQGVIQYSEVCSNAGDLPDFNALKVALEKLD